jgi:hypothetical protein
VVIVDLPDRVVETIVVFDKAEMPGFGKFIERVATCDPSVVFVAGS